MPKINTAPNAQSLAIPLKTQKGHTTHPPLHRPQHHPGAGMGMNRLPTALASYQSLSRDLVDRLGTVSRSIIALQKQLDSLAGEVLQTPRGLDLLTPEKGGLCLFLQEDCCFYVNPFGIVSDAAQNVKIRASRIRQPLSKSWGSWSKIWGWAPCFLPLWDRYQ